MIDATTPLPCPFCKAVGEDLRIDDFPPFFQVECLRCHAAGPLVDPADESAIAAWNRRPEIRGA